MCDVTTKISFSPVLRSDQRIVLFLRFVCIVLTMVFSLLALLPVTAISMVLAFPTVVWLVAYLIPQIYMAYREVPDLAKKYKAEWALVTGAGSGIGKALAFKLASQGLNVVVVSLDDNFLKETMTALKAKYPSLSFRAVGVNFIPGSDYMDKIKEATKDIEVPIIFSNAGFMVTGFLETAPIGKLLANMECNATSGINIAHHFVTLLIQKKKTGCIVFTSSIAAAIPTPFSVMYASTKAFISQFAACLHVECKPLGIDVCAIHPSPVASNFYSALDHKVDMIEAAAKSAVTPESVTDDMLKSVGVCAWRDMGGMAIGTRMGTFFLPMNFFSELFATIAPFLPDWKTHNKNRS
jgi:short-subunit dehydrogenase